MYFRLSFPCNPKGAYCHRVCIENYHAWQISNQSSVRTCEDDLTILRVNHASTGAKRPHRLQYAVNSICGTGSDLLSPSVKSIISTMMSLRPCLAPPCPVIPCHAWPWLVFLKWSLTFPLVVGDDPESLVPANWWRFTPELSDSSLFSGIGVDLRPLDVGTSHPGPHYFTPSHMCTVSASAR